MSTNEKPYEELRSARWFGAEDIRAFGHRSRAMQMGYDAEDWMGKPIIGIPVHLANDIVREAHEMTAFEDSVEEEVTKGGTIIGLYPATTERTQAKFKAWRQTNNR